jgi:hypothetical protein
MAGAYPEPNYVSSVSHSHGPLSTEWDRLRPIIKRLYTDEGKTLNEVMTIMARDHNHRANIRMYKHRIKRWGLDKKTKEHEAWAILRKNMQREAVGKQSAFKVRGKTITIDQLLFYFKRKGILDPERETQNRPRAPTPTAVECWTPAPSPDVENEEMVYDCFEFQDAEPSDTPFFSSNSTYGCTPLGYLNLDQTRQILFSSPEIQPFDIPSALSPPRSFVVLEGLFGNIATYFSSAFDSRLFVTDGEGYLVSRKAKQSDRSADDFLDLCYTGINLMNSNSYIEGRLFFSKASSVIKDVLLDSTPHMLGCILDALLRMGSNGYHGIGTLFCTYLRDMAVLIFPTSHPLRQLFSHIAEIQDEEFQSALLEGWRCISTYYPIT